jgi:hypothetical protein
LASDFGVFSSAGFAFACAAFLPIDSISICERLARKPLWRR